MDPASGSTGPLHVAIVRLTSLGDVIHTLPLAAALRRARPEARILWLVEEREQVLLRDNPVVDDVIVVPLRRWRRGLTTIGGWRRAIGELRELARTLRRADVGAAIDVQGWAHKTSPLLLLTRAPVRIGFDRRFARDPMSPLATNRHVTPPPAARHIVDQNLCLLGPLGIPPPAMPEFPLPAFAESEARAARWREAEGIGPQARLAVILPSTRGEAKRWPADRYREIARRLLSDDDRTHVLVLGGPGEERLLDDVRAGLPAGRAHAWAPGPIPDLVAVIRHAHFTIGNDTGPLHVAAANGVPALGLFGPTQGARNGPYGAHCAYVQSPTGRIVDLSVDDVFSAAERVFHR